MKEELETMRLNKIEILNLWCKDEPITITFDNRVTFLTGINGSGKSSLLNVIFDSLICNPKKFSKASTSKNRFWSSRATFNNSLILDSFILPNVGIVPSDLPDVEELLQKNTFDLSVIREIQNIFENATTNNSVSYIDHDSELKGEWWKKAIASKNSDANFNTRFENHAPLGFLFQEDRAVLHNVEKTQNDYNSIYWGLYSSSIDKRFVFCRDAVQIREAYLNKQFVEAIKSYDGKLDIEKFLKSSVYQNVANEQKTIEKVINILDEYLLESGKCVVRDETNKITLGYIQKGDEPKTIAWNLLSRGEKTLLYLFFAVYYYKDRISVFLLDEPEISFHVTWQKRLIRDLSILAPKNQFIIATHSPSLVMDGWLPNCLELKKG